MGLSSLLSIARSALLTHQKSMDVTGHNIANAQTPGYTRQRLELRSAEPLRTPAGLVGRGLSDVGITRARDNFLDAAFRREQGALGRSNVMADLLGQVEAAFNEPSDAGIGAALDTLWDAFSDLANDPSNPTPRSLVQQAGRQLVNLVRRVDTQITLYAEEASARMSGMVTDINTKAQEIAALNAEILASGGPNRSAPDLMDRRDLLIDEMSDLIGVRVLDRGNGVKSVLAGDTLLVDGGFAQQISKVALPGGGFGIALAPGNTPINPQSGQLKGLSELTSTVLPGIRAQFDGVVSTLVAEVNAIHRSGYTQGGATGTDFFDAAGITGATFALAAAVDASGAAIAAAGANNAPGDGSIALRLAGLRTQPLSGAGNRTLSQYYGDVVTGVGAQVQSANQTASSLRALVDHVDTQRAGVSGVSIDEEMVHMITNQQAYAAAARLVTVADEMLQELLRMV